MNTRHKAGASLEHQEGCNGDRVLQPVATGPWGSDPGRNAGGGHDSSQADNMDAASVPDSEGGRVWSVMKRPHLPANERHRTDPTDPISRESRNGPTRRPQV